MGRILVELGVGCRTVSNNHAFKKIKGNNDDIGRYSTNTELYRSKGFIPESVFKTHNGICG